MKNTKDNQYEQEYCSCGAPLPPDYNDALCQECVKHNWDYDTEYNDSYYEY